MDPHSVTYSNRKLQKKFGHLVDFGVSTNWNNSTAVIYQAVLHAHLISADTTVFNGYYRNDPVYLCVDLHTQLCVIVGRGGVDDHEFVSAWKLGDDQFTYATTPPYRLGGG